VNIYIVWLELWRKLCSRQYQTQGPTSYSLLTKDRHFYYEQLPDVWYIFIYIYETAPRSISDRCHRTTNLGNTRVMVNTKQKGSAIRLSYMIVLARWSEVKGHKSRFSGPKTIIAAWMESSCFGAGFNRSTLRQPPHALCFVRNEVSWLTTILLQERMIVL